MIIRKITELFQRANQILEDAKLAHEYTESCKSVIQAQDIDSYRLWLEENQENAGKLTDDQRRDLLLEAIQRDDEDIFKETLGAFADGDPNYEVIEEGSGFDAPIYHRRSSLLYNAILNKKCNVALSLARDPQTDLSYQGRETGVVIDSGIGAFYAVSVDFTKDYAPLVLDLALDLAKEKGMEPVVEALKKRGAPVTSAPALLK